MMLLVETGNSVVDLLSHDDDDDDDVDLLSHPLQCDFLLGRRPTKYKSFTENQGFA